MKKNQFIYNLAFSIVALIASTAINFILAPYLVKNVSAEAYGFVSLSTDFVTYLSLISVAINSMAGRFVSISLFKNDIEDANLYLSSVFITTTVISLILILPMLGTVLFINKFINISQEILIDVKFLFAFIFLNFLVTLVTSVFTVGTFVQNKLYLTSIRSAESILLRGLVIFVLFGVFKPRILFVGIATLVSGVYIALWNYWYTRKFSPNLEIKLKYFKGSAIKEVLSAGMWNTLLQVCAILSTGLNLLICNLFLNGNLMGILALSNTLPTAIVALLSSIKQVFGPPLTKQYATGVSMYDLFNKTHKIISILFCVPLGGFIVFGDIFYTMWLPDLDSKQLQILSVLSILALTVVSSTSLINNILVIQNKVKFQSIVLLGTSLINISATIILVKFTNFGVYVIPGVGSVLSILQNIVFTLPYGSKCLGQKWYKLYIPAAQNLLCVIVSCLVCLAVRWFITPNTWFSLIVICSFGALLSYSLVAMGVLSKSEKKYYFNIIKSKFFCGSKRKLSR